MPYISTILYKYDIHHKYYMFLFNKEKLNTY